MSTRNIIFIGLFAVLLLLALIWVSSAYKRDMSLARERIQANNQIIETACGPIEYAEAGVDQPVLVIHGAR
jgi:2-hydroxy-6-oxonona-2,4-dienedioate hydrolase